MSDLKYPDNIKYTKEHVWFKDNGDGTATIGITDFAQDELGEVAYVDLPAVGTEFSAGKDFGMVESVKAASELYMPVTGEVLAINEALADEPTLVNTASYTDGWMMKIKPSADADSTALINAVEYSSGL